MDRWQIGVFLSSLGLSDLDEAARTAKSLKLNVVQLPPFSPEFFESAQKDSLLSAVSEQGLIVSAGCAGFPGEDYSDMDAVKKTVGYSQPETLEERLQITSQCASVAQEAGASLLTAHVGVVPEDKSHPAWSLLVEAAQRVADDCGEKGLLFGLETGQETAEWMLEYLEAVNRDNVKINFDPANMILYGTGDPIPALKTLKDLVVHVHCKDGTYPEGPGQLGTEVPLGEGKVGVDRYLDALKEIGYEGPLIIEREAGDDRIGDISQGRDLLLQHRKRLWGQ